MNHTAPSTHGSRPAHSADSSHRAREQGDAEKPQTVFCRMRDAFHVLARVASNVLGTPWSFILALTIIVIWGATGPMFNYSDTWQLIINTGTTIVTFLMVFLIQNTQNRDAKAVHLKLDELIRALKGARNRLVDLEKLSDEELEKLEKEFERIQHHANHAKTAVSEIQAQAEE